MRSRQHNRQVLMPQCEIQALLSNYLREAVKAIVRDELRNMFPSSHPRVASNTDVAKDEFQRSQCIRGAATIQKR